jgi:hypothetical protein
MFSIADYGKEIVALAVPVINWIFNIKFRPRVNLIWSSPHSFSFLVDEPIKDNSGMVIQERQNLSTQQIKIVNAGRETAHKVEVIFNFKPLCLNLWPIRSYDEKMNSDRRYMLIFDNLSPGEEIGFEMMCVNGPLPDIFQVRCAECVAKNVHLSWYVSMPQWKARMFQGFIFLGMGVSVYLVVALIQFLVLKTPI